MQSLTELEKKYLIKCLENGDEIHYDFKEKIFPTNQKEYELVYGGKMRKEDLLANEDGTFPVPLQPDKIFNDKEYKPFKDGWNNMIVFGDNLQFLKTIYENNDPLIKNKVKGKIKLIYIDPPFATAGEFQNAAGVKAYNDKKKGAEFVEFLRRRLILAREILADDGSIYIHLDEKMSHYIKILADEIFNKNNFRSNITWEYQGSWVKSNINFPKRSQQIFRFTKSEKFIFNQLFEEEKTDKGVIQRWSKYIVDGKIYGKNAPFEDGKFEPYINKFIKENNREPEDDDVIAEFKGQRVGDVWYISTLNPFSTENLNYPTQKPEDLLKRIIETSSNKDDIVLDFFGGAGTTMAVAEKLGRKWITCDIGKFSYFTMQKRILQIQNSKNLENECKVEEYGNNSKSFMTVRLGSYDLKETMGLNWPDYKKFVTGLFELEIKKHKIAGIEFEGKKGDYSVKIFNYNIHKNSLVDTDYLERLHVEIGNKVNERIYIIAPANSIDFFTDYYKIGKVRYYFLKIPYYMIRELHKKPFQKIRQPRSKNKVNEIEEAIGFHFIRQPEVTSKILKDDNRIKLRIEKFSSSELNSSKTQEEASAQNFELLSAIFIDINYDGKAFKMDEAFFADELEITERGIEIDFEESEIGKQIMVIYTDIYGNDFTENHTI